MAKKGNKLIKITIPINGNVDSSAAAFGFYPQPGEVFGEKPAKVWLPKSQITDWIIADGAVSCWLPAWLVTEKELEQSIDTRHEPNLFN